MDAPDREKAYQAYTNEVMPNGNTRLDNIVMSLCGTEKQERHVAAQIDMAFQAGWNTRADLAADARNRALEEAAVLAEQYKVAHDEERRGSTASQANLSYSAGKSYAARYLHDAILALRTAPAPDDQLEAANAIIATERAEVLKLRKAIESSKERFYAPGVWRCPSCDFRLIQSNLNTKDGIVTANDVPGEKCPNCQTPLWRVSWEDEARDAYKILENLVERAAATEAKLAVAVEALETIRDAQYSVHMRSVARQALAAVKDTTND